MASEGMIEAHRQRIANALELLASECAHAAENGILVELSLARLGPRETVHSAFAFPLAVFLGGALSIASAVSG